MSKHTANPANSDSQTWYFDALDTLFFRESRPMDSMGNSELSSLFPPSARTLIGAIRSLLAEAYDPNLDWQDYHQQKQEHPLATLIGYRDDLAKLRFSGVWLYKNGQRLYAAPNNLMQKMFLPEGKKDYIAEKAFFLKIADKENLTHCDLGKIRLPEIEKPINSIEKKPTDGNSPPLNKTLNNIWLTEAEFAKVLNGNPPDPEKWFTLDQLRIEEPRIGIARDNKTRNVEKGRLYQTKHIRLIEHTQLAMDVSGIEAKQWESLHPKLSSFTRLGGEGRMASIAIKDSSHFIAPPKLEDNQREIILYLLTPMLLGNKGNKQSWQPLPDFKEDKIERSEQTQTVWKGTLNGIALTLHSAITGKAQQEGGWDLAKHQPKPVQSYIPAGSVFYCTTDAAPNEVIEALHGKHIGDETELGRGKLAIGQWV